MDSAAPICTKPKTIFWDCFYTTCNSLQFYFLKLLQYRLACWGILKTTITRSVVINIIQSTELRKISRAVCTGEKVFCGKNEGKNSRRIIKPTIPSLRITKPKIIKYTQIIIKHAVRIIKRTWYNFRNVMVSRITTNINQ